MMFEIDEDEDEDEVLATRKPLTSSFLRGFFFLKQESNASPLLHYRKRNSDNSLYELLRKKNKCRGMEPHQALSSSLE